MARPQKRKRSDPDEPSHEPQRNKKLKSAELRNYSPQFWDELSKVGLWPRALQELDRRTSRRSSLKPVTPEIYPTTLARFARRGGPDLNHLRGVSNKPATISQAMASGSTSSQSVRSRSTKATTVSTRKKVSASSKGPEFERHLVDHKIYPVGYLHPDDRPTLLPDNLDEFVPRLAAPRGSLSPSRFPESSFRNFQRQNNGAVDEGDVMRSVLPLLCGDSSIPSKQNSVFTNLEPITSNDATRAQPDLFDGAHPHRLDKEVQYDDDLNTLIVPTKHPTLPIAPNFFLEAKGPDGSAAVVKRQACYDGAYGARAMHALQNYGKDEPEYDGNAYAFSSTYHAGTGTLAIHAHHVTAPLAGEERPEYHMTKIRGFDVTDSWNTHVDGTGAFRNARDMAQEYRDQFIEEANTRARARGLPLVPLPEEVGYEEADQDEASSHDEFVDCEDPTDGAELLYCSSTLYAAEPASNTPQPLAQYLTEDEPFDSSQAPLADDEDPSMSFTTSLTSSLSTEPSRSKRSRQASSPPSTPGNDAKGKSRVPPNELERAEPKANQSSWVNAYIHKKQICFRNQLNQEIKTHRKEWHAADVENVGSCFYWRSTKSGRVFWTVKLPK